MYGWVHRNARRGADALEANWNIVRSMWTTKMLVVLRMLHTMRFPSIFGWRLGSGTPLQRLASRARYTSFEEWKYAIVHIDDISIFSKAQQQRLRHVENVYACKAMHVWRSNWRNVSSSAKKKNRLVEVRDRPRKTTYGTGHCWWDRVATIIDYRIRDAVVSWILYHLPQISLKFCKSSLSAEQKIEERRAPAFWSWRRRTQGGRYIEEKADYFSAASTTSTELEVHDQNKRLWHSDGVCTATRAKGQGLEAHRLMVPLVVRCGDKIWYQSKDYLALVWAVLVLRSYPKVSYFIIRKDHQTVAMNTELQVVN